MEKFEGEVRRLQGLLRDSDKKTSILETELRKAQSIYLNSADAKQVCRQRVYTARILVKSSTD